MGGISQDQICEVLRISKPTLNKHYRDELDTAYSKANAKVVQTAFQLATSGKSAAMTMFWLKTRMGWTEKRELAITENRSDKVRDVAEKLDELDDDQLHEFLASAGGDRG